MSLPTEAVPAVPVSRRMAWALVTREVAELFRYNGPVVSDLLRDYGPHLVSAVAEDGQDVATLLEALAALLTVGEAEARPLE